MDEEALLTEMEVTGQAFDSLQEQNGMVDDGVASILPGNAPGTRGTCSLAHSRASSPPQHVSSSN